MPLLIGVTNDEKEGTYRRKGLFNTDKAEKNDDQEEQGVLCVVPIVQGRLKAKTSMVCKHLLSQDRI